MDYGLDGSGADLTDAQLGLCRYLNYQEVYTPKFNEKDVKAMIKDRQKPTMMSGFGYHTTTGKKPVILGIWMGYSIVHVTSKLIIVTERHL